MKSDEASFISSKELRAWYSLAAKEPGFGGFRLAVADDAAETSAGVVADEQADSTVDDYTPETGSDDDADPATASAAGAKTTTGFDAEPILGLDVDAVDASSASGKDQSVAMASGEAGIVDRRDLAELSKQVGSASAPLGSKRPNNSDVPASKQMRRRPQVNKAIRRLRTRHGPLADRNPRLGAFVVFAGFLAVVSALMLSRSLSVSSDGLAWVNGVYDSGSIFQADLMLGELSDAALPTALQGPFGAAVRDTVDFFRSNLGNRPIESTQVPLLMLPNLCIRTVLALDGAASADSAGVERTKASARLAHCMGSVADLEHWASYLTADSVIQWAAFDTDGKVEGILTAVRRAIRMQDVSALFGILGQRHAWQDLSDSEVSTLESLLAQNLSLVPSSVLSIWYRWRGPKSSNSAWPATVLMLEHRRRQQRLLCRGELSAAWLGFDALARDEESGQQDDSFLSEQLVLGEQILDVVWLACQEQQDWSGYASILLSLPATIPAQLSAGAQARLLHRLLLRVAFATHPLTKKEENAIKDMALRLWISMDGSIHTAPQAANVVTTAANILLCWLGSNECRASHVKDLFVGSKPFPWSGLESPRGPVEWTRSLPDAAIHDIVYQGDIANVGYCRPVANLHRCLRAMRTQDSPFAQAVRLHAASEFQRLWYSSGKGHQALGQQWIWWAYHRSRFDIHGCDQSSGRSGLLMLKGIDCIATVLASELDRNPAHDAENQQPPTVVSGRKWVDRVRIELEETARIAQQLQETATSKSSSVRMWAALMVSSQEVKAARSRAFSGRSHVVSAQSPSARTTIERNWYWLLSDWKTVEGLWQLDLNWDRLSTTDWITTDNQVSCSPAQYSLSHYC
jgi:hypothetical protein